MNTVMVVEDQTALRDLICRFLETFPTFQLVADTGDGEEAYRLCLKYKPDFLILDIMLPNLNGVAILERLKREKPHTRILVFSASHSTGIVRKLLELGISGYVEKQESLEELEKAIQKIISGQTYFSERIINLMRDLMINPEKDDSLENLTSRELEIIKLIAESCSTKEIADKLYISPRTVDTHRVNIMNKLNLHDVAGLTRYAIAHGLIELPENL